jgi:hypothetical protein
MHGRRWTERRWRVVLALVALLGVLVTGYEAWHGVPRAWSETTGRLGMETTRLDPGRVRVTGLQVGSPLAAAGVSVGDVVVAERWYDLARGLRPGETVRLGIEREGRLHAITVQAVQGPHSSLAYRLFVLVHVVTCFAGMAFGVLIGWRLSHAASARALALAFIVGSINLYPNASPPGWPQQIEQLAFSMALAPGWFALACFAVQFPDDAPTPLRARLQRWLPALAAIGAGVLFITALRGLGLSDRWHVPAVTTYQVITGLVVIACLVDGRRRSVGPQRMRFSWLLVTFGLLVVPSWLPALPEYLGWTGAGWLFVAMSVSSLLAYAGFAYAVLRHRVLDLGVALDRSLALALAGVLVFGALKLVELMAAQLARPDDPLLAALLGAGLALLGFVAYRRLRPRAATLLDQLLFPRWVARAAALRQFTDAAAEAPDPAALADGFVEAVKTFNLGGGAAIYSEEEPGHFIRMASSLSGASPCLAADDPTLVALCSSTGPATDVDGSADPQGAVCLPMTCRAGRGLVLLVAQRPDESRWNADDLRVLGEAALSIGAQLQLLLLMDARSRTAVRAVEAVEVR